MKLTKSLVSVLTASAVFGLVACSDDTTSEKTINNYAAGVGAVETFEDLPPCDESSAGLTALVSDIDEIYGCYNGEWRALSGSSISVGSNFCKSVELEDHSGFDIYCNDHKIGTVMNGATGEKGEKGETGAKGETGEKGEAGAKGDSGVAGPQGIQGVQGIQGEKGEKGDKGETGATGETGARGPQGEQGEQGAKGETGATGTIDDTNICAIMGSSDISVTIRCESETFEMDLYKIAPDKDAVRCTDNDPETGELECANPSENIKVAGQSQKGPFTVGASVDAYELANATLKQTGNSFKGTIEEENGQFNISTVKLASQYVYLVADGFYRNEVTGMESNSAIKLRALADMGRTTMANINLVTHLEYDRVFYLVNNEKASNGRNMRPLLAKKKAESEIFSNFYIDDSKFKERANEDYLYAEDMNVLTEGDGNGALLAISVLLQGDRTEAQLTSILASFSVDIARDGRWDRVKDRAAIADWAMEKDLLKDGLSVIRSNIDAWELGGKSKAPAFEKHARNFWYQELGLGNCDASTAGQVRGAHNKYSAFNVAKDSAYTQGDSSLIRCICEVPAAAEGASAAAPYWRIAKDFEKDTVGWTPATEDGEVRTGNINTDLVYVFENGKWRRGTTRDLLFGLSCLTSRKGLTHKEVIKEQNQWYTCDTDGSKIGFEVVPTSWREATVAESDTAGWEKPEADGKVMLGNVNRSYVFVYEGGKWRRGTELDFQLDEGCLAADKGRVVLKDSKYYTCTDEKKAEGEFIVLSTWRASSADEADNSFWGAPESKADSIRLGNIDKTRIYVYENAAWRRGTELDYQLGTGCLASNKGLILINDNDKGYYTCSSEKKMYGDVTVATSWRSSTADEADTYGWTAPESKKDSVKLGNIDKSRVYVYEDGWRIGTEKDMLLGDACTKDKVGRVAVSGSDFYTCAEETSLVNGVAVPRTWRASTSSEADIEGWGAPKNKADSIRLGNIDQSHVFVYEEGAWRRGTTLDLQLGEVCLASRVNELVKFNGVYYTCTAESKSENGTVVSTTWRSSVASEADTYGWSAPESKSDSVRVGNFDATHIFVYEEGDWRRGTTLDLMLGEGCLAGKKGEILRKDQKYYTCTAEAVTEAGATIANSWRASTAAEADTYGWSAPVSKSDSVRQGNIDPTHIFVYENDAWRRGTSLDFQIGTGCIALKKNTVTVSDGQYYTCTGEKVVEGGVAVSTTYRLSTAAEADKTGWTAGEQGDIKLGNIDKNHVFVYEGSAWRRGTALDYQLGEACLAETKDKVLVSGGNYYTCTAEKTTENGVVIANTWRASTAAEADIFGWAAGEQGDIKLGNIDRTHVFVYEGTAWRPGSDLEFQLGRGCLASRKNEILVYKSNYYTCTSESVTLNAVTIATSWRFSTADEADTYGWAAGEPGAVKLGNIDNTRVYVFENGTWRHGSRLEFQIGLGCLASQVGQVVHSNSKYYTCTADMVSESGYDIATSWRYSTADEADTFGWTVPSTRADSVKLGNIDKNHIYVYENAAWRFGTALDRDAGLGPCVTKDIGVVRQKASATGTEGWYKCVENETVSVENTIIPTVWREASMLEYDVAPFGTPTENMGVIGAVTKTYAYVYDVDVGGWRLGTVLDTDPGLRPCTPSRVGDVDRASAVNNYKWYYCDDATEVLVMGQRLPSAWRLTSIVERNVTIYEILGEISGTQDAWFYGTEDDDMIFIFDAAAKRWYIGSDLDRDIDVCSSSKKGVVMWYSGKYKICAERNVTGEESPYAWRDATPTEYNTWIYALEDNCRPWGIYRGIVDRRDYYRCRYPEKEWYVASKAELDSAIYVSGCYGTDENHFYQGFSGEWYKCERGKYVEASYVDLARIQARLDVCGSGSCLGISINDYAKVYDGYDAAYQRAEKSTETAVDAKEVTLYSSPSDGEHLKYIAQEFVYDATLKEWKTLGWDQVGYGLSSGCTILRAKFKNSAKESYAFPKGLLAQDTIKGSGKWYRCVLTADGNNAYWTPLTTDELATKDVSCHLGSNGIPDRRAYKKYGAVSSDPYEYVCDVDTTVRKMTASERWAVNNGNSRLAVRCAETDVGDTVTMEGTSSKFICQKNGTYAWDKKPRVLLNAVKGRFESYNVVVLGNQYWTASNLYTTEIDGSQGFNRYEKRSNGAYYEYNKDLQKVGSFYTKALATTVCANLKPQELADGEQVPKMSLPSRQNWESLTNDVLHDTNLGLKSVDGWTFPGNNQFYLGIYPSGITGSSGGTYYVGYINDDDVFAYTYTNYKMLTDEGSYTRFVTSTNYYFMDVTETGITSYYYASTNLPGSVRCYAPSGYAMPPSAN